MKRFRISIILFSAAVLNVGVVPEALSAPALEAKGEDGSRLIVQSEMAPAQVLLRRVDASGKSKDIIWSYPLLLSGITNVQSFDALDLKTTQNRIFLCYKAERSTFVGVSSFLSTNATNAPVELAWDRYGATVIGAKFSTTNGVPLLMLGMKNKGGNAWTYEGGNWIRAKQFDVTIPSWARPIDLSDKKLGVKEFFPFDYYTNANWGPVSNNGQLGLHLSQTEYGQEDSIAALVHIRNLSELPLRVRISTLSSDKGPIRLSIFDGEQKPVATKLDALADFIVPLDKTVDAKTQEVSGINLKQFNLVPGTYTVSAELKIPAQDDTHEGFVLKSGSATFRITDK